MSSTIWLTLRVGLSGAGATNYSRTSLSRAAEHCSSASPMLLLCRPRTYCYHGLPPNGYCGVSTAFEVGIESIVLADTFHAQCERRLYSKIAASQQLSYLCSITVPATQRNNNNCNNIMSSSNNNTNTPNRSQAVEIAVDAHATRLLQQHSPPEACIDSSLGPYVTSILREALSSSSSSSNLSSLPEYDSVVELLESQCQMIGSVARDVISTIALAVRTGEVSDSNANIANADTPITSRSRSKSLGAEPKEYDVGFLGKILQETMSHQVSSLTSSPMLNPMSGGSSPSNLDLGFSLNGGVATSFSPPMYITNSHNNVSSNVSFNVSFNSSNTASTFGGGAAPPPCNNNEYVSKNFRYQKQRHVSFDETHLNHRYDAPQCQQLPLAFNPQSLSTSSIWYSSTPVTTEILEDEAHAFDPLEASLGFLDLEEEDEEATPNKQLEVKESNDNEVVPEKDLSSDECVDSTSTAEAVHSNAFLQCQPISSEFTNGNAFQENNNCYQRPPSSKRTTKGSSKKHSKKEAEDLAAALFFNQGRPRSNSLMDQRHQRPQSTTPLRPLSMSASSNGLSAAGSGGQGSSPYEKGAIPTSSASSSTSVTSATTFTTEQDNSGAVDSTTQLLLTLNYNLGQQAASLASQLTDGDINLAQYLIESARSATTGGNGFNNYQQQRRRPRICRHELQGTCYRADCPYSHDIAGLTCLFWLKGRCHHTDGSTCRFMHGYAESLLEGVSEEYFVELQAKKEQELQQKQLEEEEKRSSASFAPVTTNLLQHNQSWAADKASSSLPKQSFTFLSSGNKTDNRTASPIFGNGCWTASVVNP